MPASRSAPTGPPRPQLGRLKRRCPELIDAINGSRIRLNFVCRYCAAWWQRAAPGQNYGGDYVQQSHGHLRGARKTIGHEYRNLSARSVLPTVIANAGHPEACLERVRPHEGAWRQVIGRLPPAAPQAGALAAETGFQLPLFRGRKPHQRRLLLVTPEEPGRRRHPTAGSGCHEQRRPGAAAGTGTGRGRRTRGGTALKTRALPGRWRGAA